jgi:hypothetical protein
VDIFELGQVFLCVLPFSPVYIVPPKLRTHLHLHVALTRTKERSLGTFQKSNALSEIGDHWIGNYCHFFIIYRVSMIII